MSSLSMALALLPGVNDLKGVFGACADADAAGDALEGRGDGGREEHGGARAEPDAHEAGGAPAAVDLDDAVSVPGEGHGGTDGDASAALVADMDVGIACHRLHADPGESGVVLLRPGLRAGAHA